MLIWKYIIIGFIFAAAYVTLLTAKEILLAIVCAIWKKIDEIKMKKWEKKNQITATATAKDEEDHL